MNLIHISVDCENNDPVDIKCGGASILGYDFYVQLKDKDIILNEIPLLLKEFHQPLMNMTTNEVQKDKYWNLAEIKECIKNGY